MRLLFEHFASHNVMNAARSAEFEWRRFRTGFLGKWAEAADATRYGARPRTSVVTPSPGGTLPPDSVVTTLRETESLEQVIVSVKPDLAARVLSQLALWRRHVRSKHEVSC